MKILFLSSQLPYPPDHGHYLRTYNVLKYLSASHEIYFFSFIKDKNGFEKKAHIESLCRFARFFSIPDEQSPLRLTVSLLKNLFSNKPYIADKYFHRDMAREIEELVEKEQIDIVHVDILHMTGYSHIFKRIPRVLVEHNVEYLRLLTLAENAKSKIMKLYLMNQVKRLKKYEIKACNEYPVVTTVSHDDRKKLKDDGVRARIEVAPNGVDVEYFYPYGGEKVAGTICWVGGMDNIYNREAVNYFIEDIFPRIRKMRSGVKFIAVGGSPSNILRTAAKRDGNIEYTGYVEDVRPFMWKSEIFVAPILSGGGTKLKVLNALAMGMPVVTTTRGAEGIEISEGENIFVADDPEVFAEKVSYLLENHDFRKAMGEKARKLIEEKYDWEKIMEMIEELYIDISTKGKREI